MNKREHLLAETLGPAEGGQFARQAAALARRRRAFRQASLAGAVAIALTLALVISRRPASGPMPAVTATPPGPAFEILSDQELVAQLKDRPVLFLKDANRITGVVFLPAREPEPSL